MIATKPLSKKKRAEIQKARFKRVLNYFVLRHFPIATIIVLIVTFIVSVIVKPLLPATVILNFSGPSRYGLSQYSPTYIARDDLLWFVFILMAIFVVIEACNVFIAVSKKEYERRLVERQQWIQSPPDTAKLAAQVQKQQRRFGRSTTAALVTVATILLSLLISFDILLAYLFNVNDWDVEWTGIIGGCLELLPFAIGGIVILARKLQRKKPR